MSVETIIFTALKDLVNRRVYRDIAPQTITTLPRITFTQVGGEAVNFLDGGKPSKKNARIQINCWGEQRDAVMALARQVEDIMRALTSVNVSVVGAASAIYEPDDPKLYGSMQDFSIWYND